MVALLKYTVLRLGLFAASLWLLLRAGAGLVIAMAGGALISLLLSYVLLSGPREQLSAEIAERVDRLQERGPSPAEQDAAIEDAAIEDAAVDALRTQPPEAASVATAEAPAAPRSGS